jgi:hypothetical protein
MGEAGLLATARVSAADTLACMQQTAMFLAVAALLVSRILLLKQCI